MGNPAHAHGFSSHSMTIMTMETLCIRAGAMADGITICVYFIVCGKMKVRACNLAAMHVFF